MEWVEEYQQLLEKDKQMFRDTINRLMSQTYLLYKKETDKPYYRFISKYPNIFTSYLEMSGWKIFFFKDISVISISNQSGLNRRQLNLSQTVFLLILRLLFEEKQKELSISKEILITNEDVYEKYLALKIKNRLPNSDEYQRTLKFFARHSLIELKRGNWHEPDSVIELYPSILLAIPVQAIEMYNKWIEENKLEGEEHTDENFDENESD